MSTATVSAATTGGPPAAVRSKELPRASRRFTAGLVIITVAALALRVAYVLIARRHQSIGLTDQAWYWGQAQAFAAGAGFVNPFLWALGHPDVLRHILDAQQLEALRQTASHAAPGAATVTSAAHPPLYGLVLALPAWLGLGSPFQLRLVSTLLGAGGVVFVGLLGREITGREPAGLLAAAFAALYPALWINDGNLAAESLTILLMAAALWLAYRFWRRPTFGRAALLGGVLGLAVLNRSETLLLYPLLVLPLALILRELRVGRRLALAGVALLAGMVVFTPWQVFVATHFSEPSAPYIVTGSGHVVAVSNCDATYHGTYLGYWLPSCDLHRWPASRDESVSDAAARRQGVDYMKHHLSRVPVVVAARIGRVWELYRPAQGVHLDTFFERRGLWPSRLALAAYYLLAAASIGGLVVMRRRRVPILPFLGLFVAVTLTIAVSIGITRYRVSADVALPALAAVAVDAAWRHRRKAAA